MSELKQKINKSTNNIAIQSYNGLTKPKEIERKINDKLDDKISDKSNKLLDNKNDKLDNKSDKLNNKSDNTIYDITENDGKKSIIDSISLIMNDHTSSNTIIKHNTVTGAKILLDENFTQISNINNNINNTKIQLYEHQKTVVKAMIELENKRYISLNTNFSQIAYHGISDYGNINTCINIFNDINNINNENAVTYNSSILSDPPGSGKTFEILSLIALNPSPKIMPQINTIYLKKLKTENIGHIKINYKNFLNPNLIFVSSSIVTQWEKTIKEYTNFTLFKVSVKKDLYLLYDLIISGEVNRYDIILVRNHKTKNDFIFDDEISIHPVNKSSLIYYYNIIANFTNLPWKRVIIDDFDTIKLPSPMKNMHALFTWYISSTTFLPKYNNKQYDNEFSSAKEMILNNTTYLHDIYHPLLYNALNVKCEGKFIDKSMKIANINHYICKINNHNDKFISAISEFEHKEIRDILEMVNSDSVETVAEIFGVKFNSVVDIFEKLLTDNYEKYRIALDVLDFVEYNKQNKNERKPINDHPEFKSNRNNINYTKEMFLKFKPIEYEYKNIDNLILTIEDEYKIIKNNIGKMIVRVKSNISNGICPICNFEIEENSEWVINKCCGVILCGICAFKIQNVNNKKPCFNCRVPISMNNIIFIGKNIKKSSITNENFEDGDNLYGTNDKKNIIFLLIKKIFSNTKIKYTDYTNKNIINNKKDITNKNNIIINNNIDNDNIDIDSNNKIKINKDEEIKTNDENDQFIETKLNISKCDLTFNNLLKSNCIMPKSNIKKIILFSNYDKILDDVIHRLKYNDFKFWKLSGTHISLNRIVEEFKNYNDNCILIINSIKYSSGINLQCATDIILAHYISDNNIITQILGRALRLHRKNELNVWYMVYENEIRSMQNRFKITNY